MTDLNQARRFLRLLDPAATEFTFQTVAEGRSKDANGLTCIRNGSFDDLAEELVALNNSGAGIFVTVNETDLKGRKKENITRVRAIWQEDDDGYSGGFPLQPSIVVETSPGRFHRYWFFTAHPPMPIEMFDGFMARMIQSYGSDEGAADLTRVMRLPGFFHNKREPTLTKLVDVTGARYPFWEAAKAFKPLSGRKQDDLSGAKIRPVTVVVHDSTEWEVDYDRLKSALAHIRADDRDTWFRYGGAIYDASGGSEEGFKVWDEWSKTTKRGNYNAEAQQRYWAKEFSSPRQNRTTLASIYSDAKQNGWLESSNHAAGPAFKPPISRLEHCFRVGDPHTGEEIPIDIADKAIVDLREKFRLRNHYPSETYWDGLRQIARSIEAMALLLHTVPEITSVDSNVDDSLYVSFLPTGMGKTSTLVEAVRILTQTKPLNHVGVIIFLSRCEEIERLANEMALDTGEYAVLVGKGRDEYNALGRQSDKTNARVLFTTQQMLEARSAGGKRFADIEAFHFQGKRRQVRIWDEAILPSRALVVGQYDISNLLKRFNRENLALTSELKTLFSALESARSSAFVAMPDLQKYDVALENALSWVSDDDDKTAVEALWALSGRTVRVRRDKYVNAVLDYKDVLPLDLGPMLILDASGRHRQTYELWFKNRGKLRFLDSPEKSYNGLTIHHWNRGAGKDAQKKDGQKIARGVAFVRSTRMSRATSATSSA